MQLHVHLGAQIDTENTDVSLVPIAQMSVAIFFFIFYTWAVHMIALYCVFLMPSALRFDGSV